MDANSRWQKLFKKAFFYSIQKNDSHNNDFQEIIKKIILEKNIETFHSKRKEEFILGRVCASFAHKLCTGQELLELPKKTSREPLWPPLVLGSISHNKNWVGAAVALRSDLLGVGIDFEEVGRAKLSLAEYVRSDEDIKVHPAFKDEELLTLIFSAKEALYKALYPLVKIYFGFSAAAVYSIDLEKKSFEIKLLTVLSDEFGPQKRNVFSGRFLRDGDVYLTLIEIFH